MSTSSAPFNFKRIAVTAFLPTLLFCIGEGAILPIIPLVAAELGSSLSAAGFVASMLMVGQLVGNLPAGAVVQKYGERWAMIGATFASAVGLGLCMSSSHSLLLGLGVFIVGLATSVFALARHAYVTTQVPLKFRARAMSTLGGIFRAGYFLGPFLATAVLLMGQGNRPVFALHIAGCASAALILLLAPGPPGEQGKRSRPELLKTLIFHRGVLLRMGFGASLIGGLRASRLVILPVVAVAAGLPSATTILVIGIAGGIDFALFYASGWIMDRHGRLWAALPSMIGLALGHLSVGLVADFNVFVSLAIFLAVSNGIGSGIIATLGADAAPAGNPAPFLGAWKLTGDVGQASGPLIVSVLTGMAGVGIAGAAMGFLGFLGAALLLRYIPRYSPKPT